MELQDFIPWPPKAVNKLVKTIRINFCRTLESSQKNYNWGKFGAERSSCFVARYFKLPVYHHPCPKLAVVCGWQPTILVKIASDRRRNLDPILIELCLILVCLVAASRTSTKFPFVTVD